MLFFFMVLNFSIIYNAKLWDCRFSASTDEIVLIVQKCSAIHSLMTLNVASICFTTFIQIYFN